VTLSHAGVGPLAEQIARRRTATFGHIARLADNVPARLVLRFQIDASLGRLASNTWKRRPGSPRNRWLEVVRQDSNCSPADLWRRRFFVVMVLERRYSPRRLRGTRTYRKIPVARHVSKLKPKVEIRIQF